jgi:putative transposase
MICSENQVVVIEDLDVKGMMKRSGVRRFGRSLLDVCFGEFRRQLSYKSLIYKVKLQIADRYFPSSKRCSGCGVVKTSLSLFERLFVCLSCGLEIDRDLNAFLNFRQLADGLSVIARGGYSTVSGMIPGITKPFEARTKPCPPVDTY